MTTRRDFIKAGTILAVASMPSLAKAVTPVQRSMLSAALPGRVFYDPALGPENGFANTFRAQRIEVQAVDRDPSRFWLMLEHQRTPIAGLTRANILFCFSQQRSVNAMRLRMAAHVELAGQDRISNNWAASKQLFHRGAEIADQILCDRSDVCQRHALTRVILVSGRVDAESLIAWYAVPARTAT
jgi:hypothetical protein